MPIKNQHQKLRLVLINILVKLFAEGINYLYCINRNLNIMKKLTLACLILLFIVTSISAQESDYAQVEKTVTYYLDGGTNNDFDTLKKAFHETATMKYIGGEGYTEVNALEFFGSRMKPGPKQDRITRIVSIDIAGNAANAKLEIEYPTFTFIDYMNLLKIDGEWKIVSKIFYRKAHE